MTGTEVGLAKLSKPRVGNMLARERLFASIDRLRERPVVWIAAEPGAGKTTLMASYLEARRLPCIWYHVDGGDADPASFFYHLGLAAQSMKRGKQAAAPLPLLTPDQGADLTGFARLYFRSLYDRMGKGSVLVLDNLHEAGEGSPLHRVLATAFEEVPGGISSFVSSRAEPPDDYLPLIARERVAFLEPGEIRLTLQESGDIIHGRTELDDAAVKSLHEQSGGWAAGLTLLIERARRGERIAEGEDRGALQPVFAYFADQLIAKDFREDTEALLELSFLRRATPAMAKKLTGRAGAGPLLARLHRRHLFTQRRMVGGDASYELHALLCAYLQHRAASSWSDERRRDVMARAARLLEVSGEREEAVRLYRELEDWPALSRVALACAPALLAQGRRATLRQWIDQVPEAARLQAPRLIYWLGCAWTMDGPRHAREHFTRAHAALAATGDTFGRVLAASAIVYTYYLELAELREMDPWIRELNDALDSGAAAPPAVELHLRSAQMFGLCFRDPDPGRIARCASRMFLLLEDASVAPHDKIATAGLLLFHCYHHAELEDGERLVRLLSPLVPQAASGAQALWWIQVGFLRMTSGDNADAVAAFETSARICAEKALSIPVLDVYVQMGLGMSAVTSGDLARADAHRLRAEKHRKSFRLVDIAADSMLRGVCASHRGEFELARECAQRHFEVAEEAGIQWQAHNALLHRAYVAYESGERAEGAKITHRARAMVAGTVFERFHYQSDLLDAFGAMVAGDRGAMRAALAEGLARGRVDHGKLFLRLHPRLLARLFAAALEEGIEVEAVQRDIRRLRLAPPDPQVEHWHWPLAVHTLGRFEVRRDGQPLEFSRKAPRKTLALLKAIVALGGADVREQSLLDALWPDDEGDAAANSLGAAVLRLRALLGDAEAVVQQAGTVSLDPARIWVDAWAFGRGNRLDLYKGAFLAQDEGEPWAVTMRERLRARFIHEAGDQGLVLERAGRYAEAVELYLRGLDADSIVEPFYQGLMRCYQRMDRRSEAVATYRRLKQILSVTLGLPPSAASERLYRELSKAESVGQK